jgi:ADP-ribosyl-[dinitrogen reductase] hydrolase
LPGRYVNRGGDADTTGAIAGMLAGAATAEAIPRRWLRSLDELTRVRCEKHGGGAVALAETPV